MLKRKLATAGLTTFIGAIILLITLTFVDVPSLTKSFFHDRSFSATLGFTTFLIMFSYPFIIVYGILASLLSEKIAIILTKKASKIVYTYIVSGALHVTFGIAFDLVFSFLSLFLGSLYAILFFIIDFVAYHYFKQMKWIYIFFFLLLPILFIILLVAIANALFS